MKRTLKKKKTQFGLYILSCKCGYKSYVVSKSHVSKVNRPYSTFKNVVIKMKFIL